MGAVRLIMGLLVAMVVVSFGVMNMDPVSVTYYRIGTYSLPFFYVLLGFFATGFVIAWVGGLFDRVRFYTRLRGYRKEVRMLRRDLEEARRKNVRLLPPAAVDADGEASGCSRPSGAPDPSLLETPNKKSGSVSID